MPAPTASASTPPVPCGWPHPGPGSCCGWRKERSCRSNPPPAAWPRRACSAAPTATPCSSAARRPTTNTSRCGTWAAGFTPGGSTCPPRPSATVDATARARRRAGCRRAGCRWGAGGPPSGQPTGEDRMTGAPNHELELCCMTVRQAALPALIVVASEHGFGAVTTTPWLYDAAGVSDRDLRRLLDDTGVQVTYIDGLITALPGTPPPRPG